MPAAAVVRAIKRHHAALVDSAAEQMVKMEMSGQQTQTPAAAVAHQQADSAHSVAAVVLEL
jgi:hypothetical protein